MLQALPPAIPTSVQQTAPVPAPTVTTEQTIVQRVTVEHTPARTDLLVDTSQWTWAELRDYVVAEIVARTGPFPRDARKEYGIFTRFMNQYGPDAIAIAKHAFGPVCDGWWGSAPISINRFAKGSDPYFAQPILQRLHDTRS